MDGSDLFTLTQQRGWHRHEPGLQVSVANAAEWEPIRIFVGEAVE